jgi:hypothetical protein
MNSHDGGVPKQILNGTSTPFSVVTRHRVLSLLTATQSASVSQGNQHQETKSPIHLPKPSPQASPVFFPVQSSEQKGERPGPASPPTQNSDMQSAPVWQDFPNGVSPAESHAKNPVMRMAERPMVRIRPKAVIFMAIPPEYFPERIAWAAIYHR